MKIRKNIAILFMALGITVLANAQDKKNLSPAETAQGKFNGAAVTIKYSAPSVRNRAIWGELVPFEKVWRAGANNATTFETDKDLTIEGQKLPAGKYSLFVIPTKDDATVIFNKVADQWGAYDYDASKDQLRVKVKPQAAASSTEKLIYTFNKDNITLSWEKWNIPFKVQ